MNPHELHDQFLQIRKLGLRAGDLEQRMQRALRRERSGGLEADGYPRSTGGGGGRLELVVADENGADDRIPVTSVENAVLARLDGPGTDRHRELTRDAVNALDTLVTAAQTLQARLASLDDLTNDTGPAPRLCECCGGKRGTGNDREDIHRGTCGDRLERPLDLCRACRGFVEQTAKPGSREGYTPTDEQIRHHEDTGRWRIRITSRPA